MIKIHCVAPLTIRDLNIYDFDNEINKLILNGKNLDIFQYKKDHDHRQNGKSKYNILSEDSTLEPNNIREITFKYSDNEEALLYLSSDAIVFTKICTFDEGVSDFESLQVEANNSINDLIIQFRNHMGLESNNSETFYRWVTRTLISSEDFFQRNKELIMTKWLYSFDEYKDFVSFNRYYVAWGNSIILEDIDKDVMKNLIDSIILTEYYYVILDDANSNLGKIINEVYKGKNLGEVSDSKKSSLYVRRRVMLETKEHLLNTKQGIGLLVTKFEDNIISLQSYKKFFTKKVMSVYEFDKLIETLMKKIKLTEDILTELENRLRVKSMFITDFILFFIGLSSLMSLALYLGEIMDNKVGIELNGINTIISNIPLVLSFLLTSSFIGAVNLVAIVLSIFLVFIYLRNRS